MWQESPEFMPNATEYDLIEYGLMAQPTLYIKEFNTATEEEST
jgi:hypothetical protein